MQKSAVIIDATTLIYYSKLKKDYDFFAKLRLIFTNLLIPTEIKNEFALGAMLEPERNHVLNQIKISGSFFTLCTTFDMLTKVILETTKGIDKGEAEAVAQHKQVKTRFLLADDKKFIKAIAIADRYVQVISTLHIIAWLDLLKFEPNAPQVIRHFYSIYRFESKELHLAYREVASWFGIHLSGKALSEKCSLSKILKRRKK
jgi:predicted nucleic acid-binding protein